MWNKIVDFFKAPVFLNDEEKTIRARALHALHINMGGALTILGTLGVLFIFPEKDRIAVRCFRIFPRMYGDPSEE